MKKTFLLLLISGFSVFVTNAQYNEWTWVNGDNSIISSVMGTQGVYDSLNHPAPEYESNGWTDNQGNFWYLGAASGILWQYDPDIEQWRWVWSGSSNQPSFGIKGVPSVTNEPGLIGFGALTWTDVTGDLWLFGAYRSGNTYPDLWRYNIATNMWTWVSGSNIANDLGVYGIMGVPSVNNYPMGRCEVNTSWVDSVNNVLWMYGGDRAVAYTSIGDLWKYDIATSEWTWMNGDTSSAALPVYGTQNVPDPANFPGGRLVYSKWNDLLGNFYFFGGSNDVFSYKNDTWKYDPMINQWTWKNGSTGIGAQGIATGTCTFDPANTPASEFENKVCWTDYCGNGWVFCSAYNNVWTYRSTTGEWSLVKGQLNASDPVNYGVKGVSSPTNAPAIVNGAVSWKSKSGNMYFLNHSTNSVMWKYVPDPACSGCALVPTALFSAPNHICPGTCTGFNNLSQYATSYLWSFPGANPSTSTDVSPTNICYNSPGNYSVQLIATSATGSDTLTLNNYITVYPYPAPQGIAQSGDTLFANPGAVSFQWYYGGNAIPGATNYFYVATQSGDFNVVATDMNNCEVEAAIFDVIAQVHSGEVDKRQLEIYPNPAGEFVVVRSELGVSVNKISVFNLLGEEVSTVPLQASNLHRETIVDVHKLPSGIYWIEVSLAEKFLRATFVKL